MTRFNLHSTQCYMCCSLVATWTTKSNTPHVPHPQTTLYLNSCCSICLSCCYSLLRSKLCRDGYNGLANLENANFRLILVQYRQFPFPPVNGPKTCSLRPEDVLGHQLQLFREIPPFSLRYQIVAEIQLNYN